MYIRLLTPYINYIELDDARRELHWCHGTFAEAIRYYKYKYRGDIEFKEIIDSLDGKSFLPEIYMSLLFGAMSVAAKITFDAFDLIELKTVDDFKNIILTVNDGIENYFPQRIESKIACLDIAEDNDEALEWHEFFRLLKKQGFTTDDIMQMTFRGMSMYLFGPKNPNETYGYDWLLG